MSFGKRLLAALTIVLMVICILPAMVVAPKKTTYDFREEQRAFNTAYEGHDPSQPPMSLEIGSEMIESDYDKIAASDDDWAWYDYLPEVDYEFQRFKFRIFEPVGRIESIYVEHEGHGKGTEDGPGYSLYIWNYGDSKWEQADFTVAGWDGDQKLARVYDSSLSDYIGPGGFLQLLAMPHAKSSCPFLYAWDGLGFKFIADINSGGGLGYSDAAHIYDFRPPTPLDYTKIDGSQLSPKDGVYILEIAEDQNEIAYVDAVKLLAIDHASNLEICMDSLDYYHQEKPFEIYTVKNPKPPVLAIDGIGKDILPVISEMDREYTEAHYYNFDTITLDLGDLSDAKQIKLLYNAYVEWPMSPEHAQRYRYLQSHPDEQYDYMSYAEVINEEGQWERAPVEFGFPQEWPRTAVLDITNWFKTEDYRLRIHNFHKIHVDYIAVDTSENVEVHKTELAPAAAKLHWKGVSVQSSPDGKDPLLSDYYSVTELAGYSTYEGNFTRYGDVLPLLAEVDDKFVVMHAGDSITVTFNGLPIPEGMERDYYVVSDAYYKENFVRHLLGQEISSVEPLPFHGMTTYPYSNSETYPHDAEHTAYLQEYNTREFPSIEQHSTIRTDYVKVDVYIVPVGGELVPVNRLTLLARWIGRTWIGIVLGLVALAIGSVILSRKLRH